MSREIPWYPELVCDSCGEVGAYDFMGDYICAGCVNFHIEIIDEDYIDEDTDLDEDEDRDW